MVVRLNIIELAQTQGTREWKMCLPPNMLLASMMCLVGSASIDTMFKINVLTVDTMWTVQDKCERTHESFRSDVGARC